MIPKSAYKAALAHFAYSSEKVARRIALKTDRKDFLSYILKANEDGMTLPELEATSSIIILAGSESTSTMLTATTNFLLRNPSKLEKLAAEIRSSFKNESEVTMSALEHLPYLKAVFQEGFRMAPPVPTQIPRIVPPEGDVVCGHNLPGNVGRFRSIKLIAASILNPGTTQTFVGLPQYAAYHHADHFVHPDTFIPEQWLPESSALVVPSASDPPFTYSTFMNDAKSVVQPFSVGPRACIGINLAYAEMRLVLSRLLWNFDIQTPTIVRDGLPEKDVLIFEDQKTYALWERKPLRVELIPLR